MALAGFERFPTWMWRNAEGIASPVAQQALRIPAGAARSTPT